MSDTSVADYQFHTIRIQVAYTQQEAADEELAYWKRRRELLEAEYAAKAAPEETR